MISLEHASYSYPVTQGFALVDISLEIPAGQFCAVIGPNKAGKSTLAYLLAGFIPHFYHGRLSGKVSISGKVIEQTPPGELAQLVGLVFQNPFNQITGTKFTVREEIAFGMENLGIPREEMQERAEAVLDLLGINSLADRPPLSLSGGQMQRVAIASILAMQPQLLILDEPTSQLDPIGSREVFSALRSIMENLSMTVVMIEHKLEWIAEFADRVIALADGKLVADGLPGQVLADPALLNYGIGQARYTLAAAHIRELGLWPNNSPLPVTLPAAVNSFQGIITGRHFPSAPR